MVGVLIKIWRSTDYVNYRDMLLDQVEIARDLGLYDYSLTMSLLAITEGEMNLGKNHHKTLTALCNLSEDYLILSQTENALALAQSAFKTSKKFTVTNTPARFTQFTA